MKTVLTTLVASGALLLGCSADDTTSIPTPAVSPAIATVDGTPITEAMLDFYSISRAQKPAEDLTPEEHEAIMSELIQMVLLSNAANADGLLQDPEFAAELELQRLQAVARRQIGAHLDQSPVTEAELQQAYDENLEQLAGVQYKARHILVEQESEARDIIAELQQGADFQELARTRSTGPSGPNGGDLGWFSADRMVPPFAAAVKAMEVGTFTSEPVQTRFGWHVILLEEKSDARAPELDSVRGDVTSIVEQQKVQKYLDSLRGMADIQSVN